MKPVIMAELISGITAIIIYIGMLIRNNRTKATLRLRYVLLACIFWSLIDVLSYPLNYAPVPNIITWLFLLFSYINGNIILIFFMAYAKSLIEESTKINKYIFYVPALMGIFSILITVIAFVNGNIYQYQDGVYVHVGSLPAISVYIHLFLISYIPVVAFLKRKEIGYKKILVLGLFGLIPFITLSLCFFLWS